MAVNDHARLLVLVAERDESAFNELYTDFTCRSCCAGPLMAKRVIVSSPPIWTAEVFAAAMLAAPCAIGRRPDQLRRG